MDIQQWARDAEPGESIVYHEGTRFDTLKEQRTFASAYRAHREGLVFLAQQRRGEGEAVRIVYTATRISDHAAIALGLVDPPSYSYRRLAS